MNNTMNSKGEIRKSIIDLNPHIVCVLCSGYFIDPVTLVECLHSFCKTCIVKHVETSKICPICELVIHKTKPFSSMRQDKTLQDIVFKIVPGLHQNEILRRKKFYMTNPAKETDIVEKEFKNKIFFNQEDKFSISIEYYDKSAGSNKETQNGTQESNPNKRYLECPGPMQVCHLKKFIAMKYDLNLNTFIIDIIYKDDLIPNNYTLIDIAYNYNWKKDYPMQFFYRIFKKSKVLLKRKRKTSQVEDSPTEVGSAVKVSSPPLSKKCKESLEAKSDIAPFESKSPESIKSVSADPPKEIKPPAPSTPPKKEIVELSVNVTASDVKRVVIQAKEKQELKAKAAAAAAAASKQSSPTSGPPAKAIKLDKESTTSKPMAHPSPKTNGAGAKPSTTSNSKPVSSSSLVSKLVPMKASSTKNPAPPSSSPSSTSSSASPITTTTSTSAPNSSTSSGSSSTSTKVIISSAKVSSASVKPKNSSEPEEPKKVSEPTRKSVLVPHVASSVVSSSSTSSQVSSLVNTSPKVVLNNINPKIILKNVSSKVSDTSDGSVSASSKPSKPSSPKNDSDNKKEGRAVTPTNNNNNNNTVNNSQKSPEVNGKSESPKPGVNNSLSPRSFKSQNGNHNNILSAIVKNLAAKKQQQDVKSTPKQIPSSPPPSTEKNGRDENGVNLTKSIPAGTTVTVKTVDKPVVSSPSSSTPPKKQETNKCPPPKKPCTIPLTSLAAFNSVAAAAAEKKSSSAEALAQSIAANYAIAAAQQAAAAVHAQQVLHNQFASFGGTFQGPYDHLLRSPYVKTDPMLKIPIMPPASTSSSSSVSSPTSLTSSSQIPSTNRLQLKVQTTAGGNNNPSAFTSPLDRKLPLSANDLKSFYGVSHAAKKYGSSLPKALNQSIRQIPNPSLLTNKGNNSMLKK